MWYFSETYANRFKELCGTPDEKGCVPWLGSKTQGGYGLFFVDKANRTAHRYAKEMQLGERIPRYLDASHECHNRSCVNPNHIVIETRQENVDRVPPEKRKLQGRGKNLSHHGPQGCFRAGYPRKKRRWSASPKRELTIDQILLIRESSEIQRVLAKRFGVSQATICRVRQGTIYPDVR